MRGIYQNSQFVKNIFVIIKFDFSGVPCGIHTTNSLDVIEHILKDNESEIILVDNISWVKKILQIKEKTKLKHIILFGQMIDDDHEGFIVSVRRL